MLDITRLTYFTLLLAGLFLGGWFIAIHLLNMPTDMVPRQRNDLAISSVICLIFGGMLWALNRGAPPSSPQ